MAALNLLIDIVGMNWNESSRSFGIHFVESNYGGINRGRPLSLSLSLSSFVNTEITFSRWVSLRHVRYAH